MTITVEFFGIPRARTGVAEVSIFAGRDDTTFGETLAYLAQEFPNFEETCLHNGALAKGFIASLNGDRFLQDNDTVISSGQFLLILSSDAGG